jgi:large subunit ribosomal protein L14
MIRVGTIVNIVDNSGGKVGCCLKILGSKQEGNIGDKIILSIKKAKRKSKIKKKMIYCGLIMRSSLSYSRMDGSKLKFDRNSVVLLNKKQTPLGTRVKGPVLEEFRELGYVRTMSLSSVLL